MRGYIFNFASAATVSGMVPAGTYVRIFYSELDTSAGKNKQFPSPTLPGVLRCCRPLGGSGVGGCPHSGRDVPRRARSAEIFPGPTLLISGAPGGFSK